MTDWLCQYVLTTYDEDKRAVRAKVPPQIIEVRELCHPLAEINAPRTPVAVCSAYKMQSDQQGLELSALRKTDKGYVIWITLQALSPNQEL